MAKMKFEGLAEYEAQLLKVQELSNTAIGEAIYHGAKEIADAVKQNINALPVDNRTRVKEGLINGVSDAQKQGLIESFGIAKLQNEGGYVHVKLGFDGYNSVTTKSFPNGQPNSMIARSVNSGTSFRRQIPFVDNAVSQHKAAAEQKMKEQFDKVLSKAV